ncbi:MAG: SpoIID/LytB domain-containing protein [Candidatus Omnitrophica bacterium]|nr:SpoIID/LytB domain-containing protein [Candidatus Omnitrophota bacterium]
MRYFKSKLKGCALALALCSSAVFCYAQADAPQEVAAVKMHIRVAIRQEADNLSVRVNGPYEIVDSLSGNILSQGKSINAPVLAGKDGILVGSLVCDTSRIFIKSTSGSPIIIDGRQFRGNIQLFKKDHMHLVAINFIELEDYIKGVLYHEASHYWPMEALKAQAIICRTFAVYQSQENASKEYDVTADVYSQVYGGRTSERYRTSQAVDDTRGAILMFNGKVLPAYFHSSCGGHTEDASLLWKMDMAPLKGVVCGFCNGSPHFKWHNVLTGKELKEKLAKAGFEIDNVKDIVISGRDPSGRVTFLRINGEKNSLDIASKDFRSATGNNIIRSTNFTVKTTGDDLAFDGFGWGHGVGLCQWGAYFMAKRGYKYNEILKYYYPGVELAVR